MTITRLRINSKYIFALEEYIRVYVSLSRVVLLLEYRDLTKKRYCGYAVDETMNIMANQKKPANQNRDIEEGSDLPQEITESYGTGVKQVSRTEMGNVEMAPELKDEDAVGDEAVGGTVATPEKNVTQEIEAAVGLEMPDGAILHTNEILEKRDDDRWDLDPASSEDYQDRID